MSAELWGPVRDHGLPPALTLTMMAQISGMISPVLSEA
jgi:hypothetical protein